MPLGYLQMCHGRNRRAGSQGSACDLVLSSRSDSRSSDALIDRNLKERAMRTPLGIRGRIIVVGR